MRNIVAGAMLILSSVFLTCTTLIIAVIHSTTFTSWAGTKLGFALKEVYGTPLLIIAFLLFTAGLGFLFQPELKKYWEQNTVGGKKTDDGTFQYKED